MNTRITRIALLVSTISTGLFAGLLWTFAVGVDPMLDTLDGPTYAQVQQTLIRTIDRGILPVILLTLLAPIVVLVLNWRHYRARMVWLTIAGFGLFALGVMVFTITLNVPINTYVLSWSPVTPPADWAQARADWDQLNSIRTPISIIAFGCYVMAMASPAPSPATQPARALSRA